MNRISRASLIAWRLVPHLDVCTGCSVGIAVKPDGRVVHVVEPRGRFARHARQAHVPPVVQEALERPAQGTLVLVVVQDRGGGQTLDVVELRRPRAAA